MMFPDFQAQMLDAGFNEIVERDWPANTVVEAHSHPFEAKALVVRGEMWLTVGTLTQHLIAGDTFHLSPGEQHDERYGSAGTTYWVARR